MFDLNLSLIKEGKLADEVTVININNNNSYTFIGTATTTNPVQFIKGDNTSGAVSFQIPPSGTIFEEK